MIATDYSVLRSEMSELAYRQATKAYTAFADQITGLLARIPDVVPATSHTDIYVNHGSNAQVLRLVTDKAVLALRVPKAPWYVKARQAPDFVEHYAVPMARVMGLRPKGHTEQLVALPEPRLAVPAIVSVLVNGEPYNKRAAKGGTWLFAKAVRDVVTAQDRMAERRVRRDFGSAANLLVGPDGTLTCVDMVANNFGDDQATRKTVPDLVGAFGRLTLRNSTFVSSLQLGELSTIADDFAKRYPNDPENDDIQAVVDRCRVES